MNRWVGWVLLFMSLVALGIGSYSGHQSRQFAQCQARYNEVNNERTRILTDVGAAERAAQRARDDALDATFTDPSLLKPADQRTPEEQMRVAELFREYRAAAAALKAERAEADAARAANPVPPPPSETCD